LAFSLFFSFSSLLLFRVWPHLSISNCFLSDRSKKQYEISMLITSDGRLVWDCVCSTASLSLCFQEISESSNPLSNKEYGTLTEQLKSACKTIRNNVRDLDKTVKAVIANRTHSRFKNITDQVCFSLAVYSSFLLSCSLLLFLFFTGTWHQKTVY
jgi:hypothetical protein